MELGPVGAGNEMVDDEEPERGLTVMMKSSKRESEKDTSGVFFAFRINYRVVPLLDSSILAESQSESHLRPWSQRDLIS